VPPIARSAAITFPRADHKTRRPPLAGRRSPPAAAVPARGAAPSEGVSSPRPRRSPHQPRICLPAAASPARRARARHSRRLGHSLNVFADFEDWPAAPFSSVNNGTRE